MDCSCHLALLLSCMYTEAPLYVDENVVHIHSAVKVCV